MSTPATHPTDAATDLLDQLGTVDAQTLSRLHDRLAAAADSASLVDVAYRSLDTPVGSLLLASTDVGLVRVAFARQGHDEALAELADRVSPRVLRLPRRLDAAARQLDDYFAGRRTAFDLPVDLRLATGYREQVLHQLREIGYGATQSYREVAGATGRPQAARAVGTACRLNPIPVVIPCHRVVRADGAIGDYAGGRSAKQLLLTLEASAAVG